MPSSANAPGAGIWLNSWRTNEHTAKPPSVLAKLAKANRGAVALFGLQPTVREVFAMSGFDKVVTIRDDEAAALAAVAS